MPIYLYECERCNLEWEKYKKIKERHLEVCGGCARVAKLQITAPSIHAFQGYYHKNLKDGETVRFWSPKSRSKYYSDRGMRQVEPSECKEMKDHSMEYEHKPKAKYTTEYKKLNGKMTRVVNPEVKFKS